VPEEVSEMADRVLWSGRFSSGPDAKVLKFTSSIDVDRRLAWYDVAGSVAHAKMLRRQRIIPEADADAIIAGLKALLDDIEKGSLEIPDDVEDIHSVIENELTKRIGAAGGKLHTARSRNDQVITDLRLFMRDAILDAVGALAVMEEVLVETADRSDDVVMPGFTHVQHAQPVTLGFHLMAHAQRFSRDASRLMDCYKRMDRCPLGSAALAGTTYNIDRHIVSASLGFLAPTENAMDSVSDRDFALEFVFAASLAMNHLGSLCEEIVFWSSPEFGFVEVSEAYSTGSSIMPQKKNPDVAELIRGRTAVTAGCLTTLLNLTRSLPMSYNRDLQEDKEPVFRAHSTLVPSLEMAAGMVAQMHFKPERMRRVAEEGFINATDLADYLAARGVPFRQAHEITGALVRECLERGIRLDDLTLEELRKHSPKFASDVHRFIDVDECVKRRTSYGGTAPTQVENQVKRGREYYDAHRAFVESERKRLLGVWNALLKE
jgi:argininosuccinate lyase